MAVVLEAIRSEMIEFAESAVVLDLIEVNDVVS